MRSLILQGRLVAGRRRVPAPSRAGRGATARCSNSAVASGHRTLLRLLAFLPGRPGDVASGGSRRGSVCGWNASQMTADFGSSWTGKEPKTRRPVARSTRAQRMPWERRTAPSAGP